MKKHVKECLDKLDVVTSTNPDEIHPRVHKELAEAISEQLAIL